MILSKRYAELHLTNTYEVLSRIKLLLLNYAMSSRAIVIQYLYEYGDEV